MDRSDGGHYINRFWALPYKRLKASKVFSISKRTIEIYVKDDRNIEDFGKINHG